MRALAHYLFSALLLAAGLSLSGCATASGPAAHAPDNFYAPHSVLPMNVQRVAVLPLTSEASRADLPEGCDALNPILLTELAKTKRFELVSVSPELLRSRLGASGWTGAEILPADFFESLRRTYACDAVLFCQLTTFRAYAPLAIGWRFKLVDVRTGQVLWAADEVFDAGRQPVLQSARQYQLAQLRSSQRDDWAMKNSPRQFGQYSAAQLLARLPTR